MGELVRARRMLAQQTSWPSSNVASRQHGHCDIHLEDLNVQQWQVNVSGMQMQLRALDATLHSLGKHSRILLHGVDEVNSAADEHLSPLCIPCKESLKLRDHTAEQLCAA